MQKFKAFVSVSLIIGSVFAFVTISHAQNQPPSFGTGTNPPGITTGSSNCNGVTSGVGIQNPLKGGCSLYELIRLVINDVVLPIGGVVVVFFIIYSGYLLVVSAGNEERLSKAKKAIMYTLIGAAILLGSWVISTAIENTIKQITAYHHIEIS